jgi:hypothetical protein
MCCCLPQIRQLAVSFASNLSEALPGHVQHMVCYQPLSLLLLLLLLLQAGACAAACRRFGSWLCHLQATSAKHCQVTCSTWCANNPFPCCCCCCRLLHVLLPAADSAAGCVICEQP